MASPNRRLNGILIADVVGYGRMIERDVDGFVARFTADREAVIEPCIVERGGAVARLAGDGVLATFPSLVEAANAAIALQRGMQQRNEARDADDEIVFRIGLNFGDIVVESDNLHGEGINVAARLESIAQPGSILTTERVAELVDGKLDAELRFVRSQRVKNVTRPVKVFEIVWQPDRGASESWSRRRARGAAARLPEAAAIVGRSAEIEHLAATLREVQAGQGQVVLLAGEAGIGKTRLADELARLALEAGARVLWGQCREDSGVPAYWPWRQLLREVERDGGSLALDSAPELAGLIRDTPSDPAADTWTVAENASAQARFRMFHALADLLRTLARDDALLVIIDDLHRADAPSLRLLEFLSVELQGSTILFLGTYRDTDVPTGHRFQETLSELSRSSRYEHVTLGNLDRATVAELLERELERPVDDELVRSIVERTGGHSLYVIETVRHLRQGGDAKVLPRSLRAIINQRLAGLPERAAHVLKGAAVIGRRFDLASLAALAERDAVEVLDALDAPLQAYQIEALDVPGSYQFTHALIREAIYDSLSGGERLGLHRDVARLLEEQGGELAQIAYHYHHAAPLGVAEEATEFSRRAAAQANRMLAFEEACRFYRQALKTARAPARPALALALAMAELAAGETTQAIATFDRTAGLAEESGDRDIFLEAAIGLEEAMFRPGMPGDLAVARLRRALAWQGDLSLEQRIRLLCALARAHTLSGDVREGWPLEEEADRLAHEARDEALIIRVGIQRAAIATSSQPQLTDEIPGMAERALATVDRARRSGDSTALMESLQHSIPVLLAGSRADGVDAFIEEGGALSRTLRQPFWIYSSTLLRSSLALARGDLEQSEARAAEALELSRWLPGRDGEGVFGMQMFQIRREQGRLRQLAPVVEHFVRINPDAATWRPGLALAYVEIEQLDKAAELLEALGRDGFAALPRDGMWPVCITYLCQVSHALQHAGLAGVLYELFEGYSGHGVNLATISCFGAADRFLGLAAAAARDWERAERHFRAALTTNERQGFTTWLAHTRTDLASMLLDRGRAQDLGEARRLLDEALATAEACGLEAVRRRVCAAGERAVGGASSRRSPGGEAVESLSRREIQVLELVAAGKDNKTIGASLFISPNTVAAHVRNILAKTGAGNRAEAAAIAVKRGLLGRGEE